MENDPESGTSKIISQVAQRCFKRRSNIFLNDLRTKNLLCDATLHLEDGGTFPVHKIILSWCSEYFMTIFTRPLHCTQETDFNLSGVTSETMRLILDYVYMGRVDINQENVCTLLESADYLDMPDLLKLCCYFLKRRLTPENCIGIMRLARTYNCPSLAEDARCVAIRNFMKVSQQIDELWELPPEELEYILGADELNVKIEGVVWDCVLRWINHDKKNKRGYIVELIKKGRLGRKFVLEYIKFIHMWREMLTVVSSLWRRLNTCTIWKCLRR
jgi:kelch-like protein 10